MWGNSHCNYLILWAFVFQMYIWLALCTFVSRSPPHLLTFVAPPPPYFLLNETIGFIFLLCRFTTINPFSHQGTFGLIPSMCEGEYLYTSPLPCAIWSGGYLPFNGIVGLQGLAHVFKYVWLYCILHKTLHMTIGGPFIFSFFFTSTSVCFDSLLVW